MTTTDINLENLLRAARELQNKFPPSEMLVEFRMNSDTLDALTRVIPAARGPLSLSHTPVRIMDEMQAGEYRLVFADGSQRVVIDGREVATIPPTKGGE